jgi:hypothetical protein
MSEFFDLNKITTHQYMFVAIIGNDKPQKDKILNDILNYKNKLNDHILIESNHFKEIENVIEFQRNRFENNSVDKIMLVIRNITNNMNFFKNQYIKEICYNGRHYKFDIIMDFDISVKIAPDIRTNIDFCFILRDDDLNNRKRIYDYYCGMFEDFESFNQFYDSDKNKCIAIDNMTRNISSINRASYYNLNTEA